VIHFRHGADPGSRLDSIAGLDFVQLSFPTATQRKVLSTLASSDARRGAQQRVRGREGVGAAIGDSFDGGDDTGAFDQNKQLPSEAAWIGDPGLSGSCFK
jgi:hypothetical protein